MCVAFEIDDHGGRRGDTAQALDGWRHPVALSEALDVLHWAMQPVLYRCIHMAIEIASDLPEFLSLLISLLATTVANNYGVVNIK